MHVTGSKFFPCFYFTPQSFTQVFMVALAGAAPPVPSSVLDDTRSFELSDETSEGYILGLGMGYLRGKNMEWHIDGKNIEELLGERELSQRGLVKRSPVNPGGILTAKKLSPLLAITGPLAPLFKKYIFLLTVG